MFDASTTTTDKVAEMSTQTVKDEETALEEDGFEYTGLDKFLQRVAPIVEAAIERNNKRDIFHGYQVKWDEEIVQFTFTHKLVCPFDFKEANVAVQKNIEKQREADMKRMAEGGAGKIMQ